MNQLKITLTLAFALALGAVNACAMRQENFNPKNVAVTPLSPEKKKAAESLMDISANTQEIASAPTMEDDEVQIIEPKSQAKNAEQAAERKAKREAIRIKAQEDFLKDQKERQEKEARKLNFVRFVFPKNPLGGLGGDAIKQEPPFHLFKGKKTIKFHIRNSEVVDVTAEYPQYNKFTTTREERLQNFQQNVKGIKRKQAEQEQKEQAEDKARKELNAAFDKMRSEDLNKLNDLRYPAGQLRPSELILGVRMPIYSDKRPSKKQKTR
jgi:hypothetical protein